MTKMKNSGVEWIGEIPENWEVKPLKTIFDFGKGLPITKENLVEKGLPVISYGQIHSKNNTGTKLKSDLFRYVPDSYLASNPNSLVHSGDFIFADTSEDLEGCGNCVYVDSETKLFAGYHTIILQSKISQNNKYISYLFKTDEWRKQIREKLVEVKLYSITQKALKTTTVILPPKSTQQRIASYLDKKCSKIEETIQNQQQVIEKLKAYKQSLITEAVTGKIKIQNGKVCGKYESYKDSKLKWLGDFKIPEVWNTIQVKSFVSIPVVDGPHESPELFDNGIPYISATAIENSKIDFSLKRGFISEKYCDECDKRYKPMRDDILMIKLGATTGQVAIIDTDERFNIWVPLAAIRCNKNIAHPKFVFYSFQSDYCLKQMEMSWTFGTQQTLGVSSIERLKIFLPNVETQKTIVDYLDKKCSAIDTAIEQKQNIIEKLTEYKKSLIYECVTGKKEI